MTAERDLGDGGTLRYDGHLSAAGGLWHGVMRLQGRGL